MKWWLEVLRGLPRDLADFAFPPACPLCNAPPGTDPVCAACQNELTTLPVAVCSQCRLFVSRQGACPLGHAALVVRSLGLFDLQYRTLLHTLKFRGDLRLGLWLGQRLGSCLKSDSLAAYPAAVAPVPLHPARQRERGFNQSAVLAREVAAALGVPLVTPLKRVKNTSSQTRLNREGRRQNVSGAFMALPGPLPSPLLLVDDVLTTGATLESCAEALRAAGAERVSAATVALAEAPAERALAA